MTSALVFLGVAAMIGLVIRAVVGLRLRSVSRQPDVSDGDLCRLEQANRISSVAVVASVVLLAALAVVLAVLG